MKTALALVAMLMLAACDSGDEQRQHQAAVLTGGDPVRGRDKIQYYGCASCPQIPGIQGAGGLVGLPLKGSRAGSISQVCSRTRRTTWSAGFRIRRLWIS